MFAAHLGDTLRQWLNLKSEEVAPAALLTFYYFLLTAATILLGAAATGIFFDAMPSEFEKMFFSLTMMGTAIFSFIIVGILQAVTPRLGLVAMTVIASISMAIIIAALTLTHNISALLVVPMYIAVEVGRIILFLQYWLITGEVFDTRQAKRIFGLVGVGGALAGITVGLGLEALKDIFSQEEMVILGCGLMIAIGGVAFLSRRYLPSQTTQIANTTSNAAQPRQAVDSYVLIIMLIVALMIVTATLAEYIFRTSGGEVFTDTEFTVFLGRFFATVGVLQLLLRLGVVGRVLSRFGILTALLILPIGMLISAGIALGIDLPPNLLMNTAMATLVAGIPFIMLVAIKFFDQIFRYTIHEAASELLWVPIPLQRRSRAKSFISGTFTATIQGLTGLLLFTGAIILPEAQLQRILLGIIAGGALLWIAALFVVRRRYVQELMTSIAERRIDFADLRVDTADNEIVRQIETYLRSDNPAEHAFALDVIGGLDLDPWADPLNDLLHRGDDLIRERLLTMAGNNPTIISDAELRDLIETPNALTSEATIAAGDRGLHDVMPLLLTRLSHPDPQTRAASARAILLIDATTNDDEAATTLQQMLWSTQDTNVAAATDAVLNLPPYDGNYIVDRSIAERLLTHENATLRKAGLRIAGHLASHMPSLLTAVVAALEDPETEITARVALRLYPSDAVETELLAIFPTAATPLQRAIVRILDEYQSPALHKMLINAMEPGKRRLFRESVDELLQIARKGNLSKPLIRDMQQQVNALSGLIYARHTLMTFIRNDDPHAHLLTIAARADIQHSLAALLKLVVLDVPSVNVEDMITQLNAGDPATISNTVELLDNVSSQEERELVIPLVEVSDAQTLVAIGSEHHYDLPPTLEAALWNDINGHDAWHAAVALDYALRTNTLPELSADDVPAWDITQEVWTHHQTTTQTHGDSTMLSSLEKTLVLRNSTLFQNVDIRRLYYVAQITNEVNFAADERIFDAGDEGETMYVVTEGRIRVYNGDQELAIYGRGECLGEIALLDLQPRTASATAIERVQALQLRHDDFYEIMSLYPDIMKSVIRLLTAKFRTASRQLADTW